MQAARGYDLTQALIAENHLGVTSDERNATVPEVAILRVSTVILAIDQGTSGTTALVVAPDATVVGRATVPLATCYPKPGWVAQDAMGIWYSVQAAARSALADAGHPALVAVGLANQRETAIAWDSRSGRPLAHAIVWQDRRSAGRCEQLRADGWQTRIRAVTGLTVDPYFSATAFEWMLAHCDAVRAAADSGHLRLGTVDAWIVWNLTGGVHRTDVSNASRTMLMDLDTQSWAGELLELFGISINMLPEIHESGGVAGRVSEDAGFAAGIPIAGVAGDQQAALFGHLSHAPGDIKVTYGTGAFLLQIAGTDRPPDVDGLLTTIAWCRNGRVTFAREGSVFVAGAVIQWLRDGLRLIEHASECEIQASRVADTAGTVIVPAFVGLGTPYWDASARGAILGLTAGVTAEHLCRAALESIAHQVADVLEVMELNGHPLRVDGGAAASDLLLKLQATIVGREIHRPATLEVTGLGVAYLAGLEVGVWRSTAELRRQRSRDRQFDPDPNLSVVSRARWREAVQRSRGWMPGTVLL